jgi:amino acid adenylation domain-containing protein
MYTGTESTDTASAEKLRALLAERLLRVVRTPRKYPLSFAQQRLWFLDQLEPNSPRYNMCSAVRLRGKLDLDALENALDAILERHEALRTRFLSDDGEPAQVADENVRIDLPLEEFSTGTESDRDKAIEHRMFEEASRPFNLSSERLFRALLLRRTCEDHVLVINMHHIVSDEWSFNIFYKELVAFYASYAEGKPIDLPELPIHYTDYALWQREWLQGATFEKQLAYWKNQLKGKPAGVDLPVDHPRRSVAKARGAARWRGFGPGLSQALKRLASQQGATPFMVLLAGFKALLYRYTRQPDIIVGSPLAGRNRVETEDLIGFFVNTLPLRATVDGEMSFRELLAQVKEISLGAYSHQDLPFEKLVEVLEPDRSLNSTPFVKVMFFLQQASVGGLALPGLEVEFLENGNATAKFDLTMAVHDHGSHITAVAQYNSDLFEDNTIARFMEHYERLLQCAVEHPAVCIGELPLLGEEERRQILIDWNSTGTDYPRDKCIHELFEEQVRKTPDAIAVTFGKSCLTYRELDMRASQLAHLLQKTCVTQLRRVALVGERSREMIIGLLGILKAGAGYTSIDPALPPSRLKVLLEDLSPHALLFTHQRYCGMIPEDSALQATTRICLEGDWKRVERESTIHPIQPVTAGDLAYISFTSGSTGRPKGVCIPHRAVVRLVRNTNVASFGPRDVFLQMAPIAFDASTFEIWGALLNGARLVVMPPETPSLTDLAEAIQKSGVTTAWFTSGLFNQIIDEKPEALKPLRQIFTGGDILSPPHIKKALSQVGNDCRIINGYGPTENTTFTTCYAIPRSYDGEGSVPIGRPISNTTCYILDERLQPVPIGVAGELFAGGDGLATGYWNAPELTKEKFIPNPFLPGTSLYRTGDLARYLPDGNIEFLGRLDQQVKIRGFRVEPGEIEAVLSEHPDVAQCAVVARADNSGAKQLVGYVVSSKPAGPEALQLESYLRQRLPEYMIPACFVLVPNIPLSSNGKVDRAALPAPDAGLQHQPAFLPPTNETERQLQNIWEQVLNVRPIGIRDKFFALGGHSLLALRLLSRVEKAFEQKLPVAALFQNPTIEQLAKLLNHQPGIENSGPTSLVEIQPLGHRQPLFLVHGVGGGMFWGYSNLARHLGNGQPIYAFKSRGLEGDPEFETIEEMADSYLSDLRKFQPKGPYYLGGYCFGGVVAYEMACRLRAQGEHVPLVTMINSNPPNSSYTRFEWTLPSSLKWAGNICRRTLVSLHTQPGRLCSHLCWRTRGLVKRIAAGQAEATWDINDFLDLSQYNENQRKVWAAHARALAKYTPGRYQGNVALLRSPVHLMFCSFARDYGWGDHVDGRLVVKIIPGMHETIMEEPNVGRLADEVKACLADATEVAHP